MKDFPIPVRSIGPGSQPPEDVPLAALEVPREVDTFVMPRVPERADPAAMVECCAWLEQLAGALRGWDESSSRHGPELSAASLAGAALEIANQVLGEGEVSIRVGGERPLRVQETAFAGLWRCCRLDAQGRIAADWVEAGALPRAVFEAAAAAAGELIAPRPWPEGVMNAPALFAEIGMHLPLQPGAKAKQINLTLLPLTPADHQALAQALPNGAVAMISRGFGNCHVTTTTVRGVWRVQYFNSMKTLILDTIEIVDIPEVAVAAPEDLADTRQRIAELLQWMRQACADAQDD
jgi:hydrogenase-1 operon protein HyaF